MLNVVLLGSTWWFFPYLMIPWFLVMSLPAFKPQIRLRTRRGFGAAGQDVVGHCHSCTCSSSSHGRGEKGSRLQPRGAPRAAAAMQLNWSCGCLKCSLCTTGRFCMRDAGTCTRVPVATKLQVFIFCSPNGGQCSFCTALQLINDMSQASGHYSTAWAEKQSKKRLSGITRATFEPMIFLVQKFHIHIKNK